MLRWQSHGGTLSTAKPLDCIDTWTTLSSLPLGYLPPAKPGLYGHPPVLNSLSLSPPLSLSLHDARRTLVSSPSGLCVEEELHPVSTCRDNNEKNIRRRNDAFLARIHGSGAVRIFVYIGGCGVEGEGV